MTKDEIYEALNYVNALREKRGKMATTIVKNPNLIPLLIAIMKDDVDPVSCKASWVLEFVAKEDLKLVSRYIDDFVDALKFVTLESSVRPASKICQLLVLNEFSKKPSKSINALSSKQQNAITEAAFDWLIGEHKVAPKAYSMTTLLLLGKRIKWIHPELRQILEQNYESGSAAYKARARMTLKVLEK